MRLSQPWEGALLDLAQEASNTIDNQSSALLHVDTSQLALAYQHCEGLTAQHSRSFYWASQLLPKEQRLAVRALYAFCRITDDIVDRPDVSGNPQSHLAQITDSLNRWKREALGPNPPKENLAALAWADTRNRYQVPHRFGEQLIEGVLTDLYKNRYQSFDELAAYSYGVASTVGLMSMYIIGFSDEDAIPYAIKLGVALQITNILRDVAEDYRNGRIYLPQDELEMFNLSEADVAAGVVTDNWRRFMRFQIERNRQLYSEAWPGIAFLAPQGRFSIGAAAGLYLGILDDIEAHDYDVFSRRAHINGAGKLARLPKIWWQTRSRYLDRYWQ